MHWARKTTHACMTAMRDFSTFVTSAGLGATLLR
jgi:hypothetical protein